MKTRLVLLAFLVIMLFLSPTFVMAQTNSESSDHTASEEAEGKAIWEKLQAKQLECKDLTNDNFELLGEYFMGQMVGGSHEVMNNMMVRMMGEEGEKQIHIAMGKRLSSCDTNAQIPSNSVGFMPMVWMMGGGNPMMGSGWGGFSIFGWLSIILFWVLLVLGVIALIRYLSKSTSSKEDKTPLEILKGRYARGEINKKEFEEKRKDLA